MRLKMLAIVGLLPMLTACADMATGLAMYADQMAIEQGNYWEDEHHSERFGGDCPVFVEQGHVNNQTYLRVRNEAPTDASVTVLWSSGFESNFYLSPGQYSEIVYMTPSVVPDSVNRSC